MATVEVAQDGTVSGLEDGATLSLKGENGVLFDQDVPKSGTAQREVFEYLIRTGKVQVQATPEKPKRGPRAAAEGDEA